MISHALNLIIGELNTYLKQQDEEATENPVVLGNVALFENNGLTDENENSINDKIVATLVKVSEEKTLKNQTATKTSNDTTTYSNPPVTLNLFILFSVLNKHYKDALGQLSDVIAFFQGKHIFTNLNTLATAEPDEALKPFRLILDLYSPTFEEANHLWGTLGGKQFPSVLYRIRLIEIERDVTIETRETIKDVRIDKS
jgi:hypothetical protein